MHLCFLGGFAASIGGVPLTAFPYDKVRALLAYLVMEPVEHGREKLAHLLWPDLAADKARSNLRRCLFDLRRLLEDSAADDSAAAGFIAANQKTLRFNVASAYRLDVHNFLEAGATATAALLEQGMRHYRGPFLAGLSLPDAPEFDAWVVSRREALHRNALARLEQLIAHHEQRNDPGKALAFAQEAIELDFWREPLQRSYLRLLSRSSPAAALAHFDNFCRALDEDLGVSPESETQALADEIRQRGSSRADQPAAPPRAERRRLVALVCDIEARRGMDPEEAAERLAAPLDACADIARKRGGHIHTAQGGELLAFFGYPNAREQAPLEAADAALDLAEALAGNAELGFRLGLHAGWGYAGVPGDSPDQAGTLAKNARRLALAAPDGGISVGAELQRIIGGYFRFEAGDGRVDSPPRLIGRSGISRRIDLYGNRMPTLVGRQRELAQLAALWSDVRLGKRLGALLRADAGMGKSRLAAALAQQVRLAGGRVVELACQAEAAHTPYYPFVEGLLRSMGIDADEAQEARRQAAFRWLAEMRMDAAALPPLLDLLGISGRRQAGADGLPPLPAERKQREESLLTDLFGRLGHGQPLLLIVEDIHWADHATQELLARLLSATGAPLLLLCTSRQAPPPAIADQLAAEIELAPLTTHATEELVAGLAGGKPFGDAVMASIVGRADGVPLYAEELARSVLAGPDENIPATLWDVLAARLDSLGPAKHLVQIAAAIGRDFSAELLYAVGENNVDLANGIEALLRAGLVRRHLSGQYRFKHSLIRDAAYQSLALAERREIHRRLAHALRGSFAGRVAERPEIIAQHLSAAIDPTAAEAWLAAGALAAAHSATEVAIHDYYAGLAALQALPETDDYRIRYELQLQVALGTALIAAEGYGSETAKSCFIRAWALSDKAPEDCDLFPMMWGLWLGGRSCDGDVHPLAFAERLERMAADSRDPAIRIAVDYAYGNNRFWLGEFERSRRHLESAIALAAQVPAGLLIERYGEDIGISSRAFLSWVRWIQGDLDGARALAEENIALARQLGHAHSLGYAMSFAAVLYRHLRLPEPAATLSQELLAHTEKHGLLLWQAVGAVVLGWSLAAAGRSDGLVPIEQGVAGARIAMRIVETSFLSFLADALLQLKRPAEALTVIAESLEKAEQNHDTYFVPEFLRLQGDAMRLQDPDCAEAAGARYAAALEQAKAGGAHILALRCATRLAESWSATGRKDQAGKLLAQALARVRGRPDYPDLQDARRLIDLPASSPRQAG